MESSQPNNCRHEYVRIYQRKIKGLERRLVATRAYLPVGFKMTDFGHLSEGSYCFCTKCRARLFPKRTAAEKAQARLALAQSKLANAEAVDTEIQELEGSEEHREEREEKESSASISVEELEVVPTELEELEESGSEVSEDDESEG